MAIDPAALRKELDALTRELSRLLRHSGEHPSAPASPVFAEPIAAAIATLGDGDIELERLIRSRPIASTLAAFAAGVALGLMLRRS